MVSALGASALNEVHDGGGLDARLGEAAEPGVIRGGVFTVHYPGIAPHGRPGPQAACELLAVSLALTHRLQSRVVVVMGELCDEGNRIVFRHGMIGQGPAETRRVRVGHGHRRQGIVEEVQVVPYLAALGGSELVHQALQFSQT